MTSKEESKICLSCLECCHWVTFTVPTPRLTFLKERFLDFYKARGFKTVDNDTTIEIVIRTTCPHLTKQGCDIYPQRPEVCKTYDGRLDRHMGDYCKLPR